MKKTNLRALLSALLVIGAMACMLIVLVMNAYDKFPERIKVREDGVTEDVFTVRNLQLCPDQSKEYDVDLVCDASGAYNVTLTYEELKPGTMKHYVDVVVSVEDETVYTGKLSTLMDKKETISFDGTLMSRTPLTVTIKYLMPYETGNEAQGTTADFDIHLKIQKI